MLGNLHFLLAKNVNFKETWDEFQTLGEPPREFGLLMLAILELDKM